MTLQTFAQVFAVLAVQLRQTDADEATIRGYYEALKDLEPEFVVMAAQHMAQHGGSSGDNPHWFPKTSEWRERAGAIERERQLAQRAALRKLERPLCGACEDTGWERAGDRVTVCDCRKLRRLEVLGRRPMPSLPPAEPEVVQPVDIEHIAHVLAAEKGMR